ncbi:threonine--tRNA ligase [Candidatus Dependentiae bacterium]|nr:threonine--tRNA ligase [Candidatus Dependentiae bacterium]
MNDNNYLHNLRHSAAHLLAQAVLGLFPGTKLTIGPVTEYGFFYDFLPLKNFKEDDLTVIEKRMRELAKKNYKITGGQIPKDQARPMFKDNQFKLELIDGIADETVGVYHQGDFYDLCKGGHVDAIGEIKFFKLTAISGSYWRANRDGIALQRISGVAFETQEAMDAYFKRIEEAELYDHRKLGKQLELFSFHDVSPGVPFFHHKGLIVYHKLIDLMRKLRGSLYQEIKTPFILNESLWHTSGHYDNYRENMFFTSTEDVPFCVKPMNCPGAILHYQERPRSYKELPLRLAEFGFVHRRELSGVLHGLFRVRGFTQDDSHTFCTVDQIGDAVKLVLERVDKIYKKFGFSSIKYFLSTRPEKSMGSGSEVWEKATAVLRNTFEEMGIAYEVDEGGGAFYGPKIDIKILDAMGREWQCGTCQIDFIQPENFKLEYIDADQSRKRPVIMHVAIYGSIERFLGILLEHFKGHLPFWLAPVQVRVLKITDHQADYSRRVADQITAAGLRMELDETGDQISAQIRRAQVDKVPWMIVLGKKEQEQNTVTLRLADGTQEFGLTLEAVLARAADLNKCE